MDLNCKFCGNGIEVEYEPSEYYDENGRTYINCVNDECGAQWASDGSVKREGKAFR